MATRRQFIAGVPVKRDADGIYWFDLDGKAWEYNADSCQLYLRPSGSTVRQLVGTFDCVKVAVGFAVGAHEGVGLGSRTNFMKVVGG